MSDPFDLQRFVIARDDGSYLMAVSELRAGRPIDAVKLRSSMTLFELADPSEPVFGQVLAKYFGGVRDEATLSRA